MRYRLRTLMIVLAIGPPMVTSFMAGCNRAAPQPAENIRAENYPIQMPATKPDEVVKQFIAAHQAWNNAAFDRSKASGRDDETAVRISSKEYDDLIARFCAPSVTPQGISYSSQPRHTLDGESVESVAIDGRAAIVRTKHIDHYNRVSEYEYHLLVTNGEWRITSLLYVDKDGKYECL